MARAGKKKRRDLSILLTLIKNLCIWKLGGEGKPSALQKKERRRCGPGHGGGVLVGAAGGKRGKKRLFLKNNTRSFQAGKERNLNKIDIEGEKGGIFTERRIPGLEKKETLLGP